MKLLFGTLLLASLFCGSVRADMPHMSTDLRLLPISEPQLGVNTDSLRDTLVNGLRATRDDQKRFIEHIVELVDDKKLPVSLVYAAFRWARKNRSDYPFPYFKYAIRELAKRKGIPI